MKTYKVALTRTYLVQIKAESKTEARGFSEFFIGDCRDLSNEIDRMENKFSIENIEPVLNEAFEVYPIRD